jgi:hypothetical protein
VPARVMRFTIRCSLADSTCIIRASPPDTHRRRRRVPVNLYKASARVRNEHRALTSISNGGKWWERECGSESRWARYFVKRNVYACRGTSRARPCSFRSAQLPSDSRRPALLLATRCVSCLAQSVSMRSIAGRVHTIVHKKARVIGASASKAELSRYATNRMWKSY